MLVDVDCGSSGDSQNCSGAEGFSLQFNDGTGWRWVCGAEAVQNARMALSGFPGGPEIKAAEDTSATNVAESAVELGNWFELIAAAPGGVLCINERDLRYLVHELGGGG